MLPRPVREVAEAHSDAQTDLAEQAVGVVSGVSHQARRPEQWRDSVARVGTQLLLLQVAAVSLSDGYVTDVLDAQGADPAADAAILPAAWEDFTDGGGSWLLNLVYAVNALPRSGMSSTALQSRVQHLTTTIVLAGIHDAARSAVQASTLTRPAAGWYVRMLRGKSCARCAILAGRRYRSVSAFRRHTACDCIHIPAGENSGDWSTDPEEYFRSLDTEDQDRIFTGAGAQAIRDGADMSQVVNARQGITTVAAFGRELTVTTVGTTKRGLYGGYEVGRDGSLTSRVRPAPPRLLPDEIYRLAEEFGWDRTETLAQLRRFAYVL